MINALSALRSVDEHIQHNYTSGQLLGTLDKMLLRAIAPIIKKTTFVDRSLSLILNWYTRNRRRRISPLPKEEFNSLVIVFLQSQDYQERRRIYSKLKLERSITFGIIRMWLREMSGWVDANICVLAKQPGALNRQSLIQKRGLVQNSAGLLFSIRKAEFWESEASKFKNAIVEKYMRFVHNKAYQHWIANKDRNPHVKMDVEEIAQNFILACHRGIDKCDADQGTLTAYLDVWIRNASGAASSFRQEYGVAYDIPISVKKKIANKRSSVVNMAVSLDEEGVDEVPSESDTQLDYEKQDYIEFIRKLAKYADPIGFGRIRLGIQESLSDSEISILHNC